MSRPDELRASKQRLRMEVRALRDAMPEVKRVRASARIEERLLELPQVRAAGTVMLFSSFGSEVRTEGMIERLVGEGRRVALPVITGDDIQPTSYRPGDPVVEAWFGAKEPSAGRPIAPEALDVVVAPGLAFDRRGYRVGYGGGYYDRLLRRTRQDAFPAGVCFAIQVVEEVPQGPGDVPVAMVVTEGEAIPCEGKEPGSDRLRRQG